MESYPPIVEPSLFVVDHSNPALECVVRWNEATQLIDSGCVLTVKITALTADTLPATKVVVATDPEEFSFEVSPPPGKSAIELPAGSPWVHQHEVRVSQVVKITVCSVSVAIGEGKSQIRLVWHVPDRVKKFHHQVFTSCTPCC